MSAKARRYQTYQRKDGSTAYIVDIRNAEGRKIRRVFDRVRDADDFYEKMRRDRMRVSVGLDPIIEEVKFSELVDLWLTRRKASGEITLSTWKGDECYVRIYLKPYLGHLWTSKIQTYHVEKLLSDLMPKYNISPATRNKIRGTLHTFFRDAIKARHALKNPVTETEKLKENRDKWAVWHTRSEIEKYLETASKDVAHWFYPYVSISIQTGARQGEVLGLRWDQDVNLDERWIRIGSTYERHSKSVVDRTKGKKARWAGINESLAEVLTEWRASRPPMLAHSGAYLITWDDGRLVHPRRVVKVHDRVCARAGIRRIRFHDLRHQFATLFVKNKGNRYALQKLLGHTTPEMTDRYSHLDPGFLQGQAEVVEIDMRRGKKDATYTAQNQTSKVLKKLKKSVKTKG